LRTKITCDACDYSACKECYKTVIASIITSPYCINCELVFTRETLINKFSKYFVTKVINPAVKRFLLADTINKWGKYFVEYKEKTVRLKKTREIICFRIEEINKEIDDLYISYVKHNDSINNNKIGGINPYNRNKIPSFVMIDLKMIVRTSKLLKIKINLEFETNIGVVTNKKTIELKALSLFQNIDELGNYSSPEWFLSLNRNQLIKFLRELSDIWNYRAQLSQEIKQKICPPVGDPFRGFNMSYITNEHDLLNVKKFILDILEKFVNDGIDRDSKTLGAYYVLAALTLVNDTAASSLPWLFQSVAYF
jgi:hypothetical protein